MYTPAHSPNRQNEAQETGFARFGSSLWFNQFWTTVKVNNKLKMKAQLA